MKHYPKITGNNHTSLPYFFLFLSTKHAPLKCQLVLCLTWCIYEHKVVSRYPFCLMLIFPPLQILLKKSCIFSRAFRMRPKVRYQSMQIYVAVFYLVASRILSQVLKLSPSSACTNTRNFTYSPETWLDSYWKETNMKLIVVTG